MRVIEITDGFTRISAGSDRLDSKDFSSVRAATGARVDVEFSRERALAIDQPVTVRYDFAGDGRLREGSGVAKPIRTVVRWGHAVRYHYRLSYWVTAAALMTFVPDKARPRLSPPRLGASTKARAADRSPA